MKKILFKRLFFLGLLASGLLSETSPVLGRTEVRSGKVSCLASMQIEAVKTTDARHRGRNRQRHVALSASDRTADFENLLSEAETEWHGEEDGISYFNSGSYRFGNSYMSEWDSWTGFSYANLTSSDYIPELGYGNQYKNVAGGGAGNSASYGLVYHGGTVDYTGDPEKGVVLQGCYLTNSVMLLNTILNGDDFAGAPFGTGDFFKAVIRGVSPDGDTVSLDYYLADYRDADTNEHYVLRTWEWVDLSGLGAVRQLHIGFEGSRNNQYGLTLPAYMAIDNLDCPHPVSERYDTLQEGTDRLLLFSDVFGLEGNGKWQVEAGEPDAEQVATVTVEKDGLRIRALAPGVCRIRVEALRNGQRRYVDLRIEVGRQLDVEDAVASETVICKLYPIPARDVLYVEADGDKAVLSIYDLQGRKVYGTRYAGTRLAVPLQSFRTGVYVLRLDSGSKTVVKRFVISR